MKKLALIAALASAVALPMAAHSATATGPFTVTVSFTPTCTAAIAARVIAFGNYTAFGAQVGPINASNALVLTCSRGIGAAATAAYGEGGAAAGLIGTTNLRYTLSAPAKAVVPGTAATGTAGGNVGTAETVTFTFSGTLPTQAGAGLTSAVNNASDARTLVITF